MPAKAKTFVPDGTTELHTSVPSASNVVLLRDDAYGPFDKANHIVRVQSANGLYYWLGEITNIYPGGLEADVTCHATYGFGFFGRLWGWLRRLFARRLLRTEEGTVRVILQNVAQPRPPAPPTDGISVTFIP